MEGEQVKGEPDVDGGRRPASHDDRIAIRQLMYSAMDLDILKVGPVGQRKYAL